MDEFTLLKTQGMSSFHVNVSVRGAYFIGTIKFNFAWPVCV